MPIVNRLNHRKSLSVIAVREGPELMLDHVCLKIGEPPDFEYAVFRHCGIPHQIASGFNISHIGQRPTHIDHRIAHDGQSDIVRYVIHIRGAEIGFHRVTECIEGSGQHLHRRYRQCVRRIENYKRSRAAQKRSFPVLFVIRNDRAVVHFRSGTGSGHDRAHRNAIRRSTVLLVFELPDICVGLCLSRDDFAAVYDAAASDCKNKIDSPLSRKSRSLLNLIVGRISHDP